MKKHRTIKKWATILLSVSVCFFLILMMSASANHRKSRQMQPYPDISIHFDDKGACLDDGDILQIIKENSPDLLTGISFRELNLSALENAIEFDPWVESAECFSDLHGTLNVKIRQRSPVVRVINSFGVSYYLDKTGEKLPLRSKFTTRVPIATGWIRDIKSPASDTGKFTGKAGEDLLKLIRHLEEEPFMMAITEQVNVDQQGLFEIVPKLGDYVIMLGNLEDIEEKTEKLKLFYGQKFSQTGGKYRLLDLRYNEQIVCKKR